VSQSTLNGVPPHLGLPVAVTYYWLRHARQRPDLPLLQALVLGLMFGELCRQRKSQRGMDQNMNENTHTATHNLACINKVREAQPMTPPLLVYQGL
jgi:hypothetical protein